MKYSIYELLKADDEKDDVRDVIDGKWDASSKAQAGGLTGRWPWEDFSHNSTRDAVHGLKDFGALQKVLRLFTSGIRVRWTASFYNKIKNPFRLSESQL